MENDDLSYARHSINFEQTVKFPLKNVSRNILEVFVHTYNDSVIEPNEGVMWL
jgi:rRNA pseudouridine-1189 N-methylase Emg1 (Nep1/Mra1 family)